MPNNGTNQGDLKLRQVAFEPRQFLFSFLSLSLFHIRHLHKFRVDERDPLSDE